LAKSVNAAAIFAVDSHAHYIVYLPRADLSTSLRARYKCG
jgi:hypothetical protein